MLCVLCTLLQLLLRAEALEQTPTRDGWPPRPGTQCHADLKRPRQWITFNTDFLVPPQRWATLLEQQGRVFVDRAAEEAKLQRPMVCPLTGSTLDSMDAVRRHVRSRAYRDRVSESSAGADLVFIQ